MINNDVLRSVRYMLDLSDRKVAEITRMADAAFPMEAQHAQAMLRKEGEPGYLECPDSVLAHFLDGLIVHSRGRREGDPQRAVSPGPGLPCRP